MLTSCLPVKNIPDIIHNTLFFTYMLYVMTYFSTSKYVHVEIVETLLFINE